MTDAAEVSLMATDISQWIAEKSGEMGEIVELREVWPIETDFSKWLAKNINVLNKLVMWEIEAASARTEVYDLTNQLRVDVLCQATKPDSTEQFNVIIENQLTSTDDDHLARILKYIQSFEAGGVIWIASSVDYSSPRAHHMGVIQWLNENSQVDAYLFTPLLVKTDENHFKLWLLCEVVP